MSVSESPSVNRLLLVLGDDLDHALRQKVVDRPSCHTHVAPHALRDDGGCDELVIGNLLLELLVQVLVEENGRVKLFLLLALGPLLLLSLAAAALLGWLGLARCLLGRLLSHGHVRIKSLKHNKALRAHHTDPKYHHRTHMRAATRNNSASSTKCMLERSFLAAFGGSNFVRIICQRHS